MADVTQEKRHRSKNDYVNVRDEALKPISERSAVVPGRNGKKKPRLYAMKTEKLNAALAELNDSGKISNPYRSSGIYGACVQALINLGINVPHSFSVVRDEVRSIMSSIQKGKSLNTTAWDLFENRKPRNKDTGKDADGRLIQTFQLLQRITGFHPYGEKLRQLNSCIDILVDEDGLPMFCLHTGFAGYDAVAPKNEMIKRKKEKKAKVVDIVETIPTIIAEVPSVDVSVPLGETKIEM